MTIFLVDLNFWGLLKFFRWTKIFQGDFNFSEVSAIPRPNFEFQENRSNFEFQENRFRG